MRHDITKYRQARVINKDLEKLREILKSQYKELNKYKKYLPIRTLLNEILNAEIIIKLHEDKNKDIIENKGLIIGDK